MLWRCDESKEDMYEAQRRLRDEGLVWLGLERLEEEYLCRVQYVPSAVRLAPSAWREEVHRALVVGHVLLVDPRYLQY